jgi:glutamate/tyrosine decarboxylase-like PLP-dependent enzyme
MAVAETAASRKAVPAAAKHIDDWRAVNVAYELYDGALDESLRWTRRWLDGLPGRRLSTTATADEVRAALGDELPDAPSDPADVVKLMATAAQPGLVASPSGRFFGFVVGGTLPAALAADWLTSAWDQNASLRVLSPAYVAFEDIASSWLLDLLGLDSEAGVGFATGATAANFTGLASARDAVLTRVGWDVGTNGLAGAPPVKVLVGAERHDTIDLALRYLGLGQPEVVATDHEGRIRPDALKAALNRHRHGPTIVCLQAGNVHSGAFDPFAEAIPLAHDAGAWVHVDGAFGLWAAASPTYRELTAGIAEADSWGSDAHKTLNVPHDCGLAIVRDAGAMRSAMTFHGEYLITDDTHLEPYEKVLEASRRARAIPVWAALRSLGRSGVAELIDGLCRNATSLAEGARQLPHVEVVNDVVFTQVSLTFGSDERTREVGRRLMEDGTVWISGSRWHDREVLRVSVSNWSTDDDITAALDALAKATTE